MSETRYFLDEYRDLVYEAPMQFPVDLLFVFRAVGMLAGLTTALDANFSPFSEAIPFASRLARGEGAESSQEWDELTDRLRQLLLIPFRVEQVLAKCEDGSLGITTNLSAESRRSLRRVERSNDRVAAAVSGAGLLIAGSHFIVSGNLTGLGWLLIAASLLLMLRTRRLT